LIVTAQGNAAWIVLLVASAAMLAATQTGVAQQRQPLRWTTTPVGSFGYKLATTLSGVAEQALGGQYAATVAPYTAPQVAMKAAMAGDGEIAFTADVAMTELRERVGAFQGYRPEKSELVHTWYAYSMQSMMAVAARNADQFHCWRDFSGKPVFFTPAGFMNWLNLQRAFRALGYSFNHVPVSVRSNAEALDSGAIAGSVLYMTEGRELAPYWRETELRIDIGIVNPCPDEVATLKFAGLNVTDVDAKGVFARNVGPKALKGVSMMFGYSARLDLPEDVVYKLVSTFYRKRDDLAKMQPVLGALKSDFIGLQVQGIAANPAMQVHPGLARFLKEHNAWDDRWVVGVDKS
jgi:uncharacterized protein